MYWNITVWYTYIYIFGRNKATEKKSKSIRNKSGKTPLFIRIDIKGTYMYIVCMCVHRVNVYLKTGSRRHNSQNKYLEIFFPSFLVLFFFYFFLIRESLLYRWPIFAKVLIVWLRWYCLGFSYTFLYNWHVIGRRIIKKAIQRTKKGRWIKMSSRVFLWQASMSTFKIELISIFFNDFPILSIFYVTNITYFSTCKVPTLWISCKGCAYAAVLKSRHGHKFSNKNLGRIHTIPHGV